MPPYVLSRIPYKVFILASNHLELPPRGWGTTGLPTDHVNPNNFELRSTPVLVRLDPGRYSVVFTPVCFFIEDDCANRGSLDSNGVYLVRVVVLKAIVIHLGIAKPAKPAHPPQTVI